MTDTNNIYRQLRSVQNELKSPKNETGRFGKSRSAEAILEAAKPVLARHDLTLVVTDKIVLVGERSYVKSTARVYDDSGNSIAATAYAWEGDVDRGLDTSQVTGKTSSYARKYAMGGLLAIDDTKDADSKAYNKHRADPEPPYTEEASQPASTVWATPKQVQMLLARSKAVSGLADNEAVIEWFEQQFEVKASRVRKEEVDAVLGQLDGLAKGAE